MSHSNFYSYKPSQQRVFFTADTHLGHNRIIEYCKRPFTSHEDMEEVMLERFNKVLRRGDLLFHLGDVCWSSYDLARFFGKLNTNQVHLVLGNHDGKKLSEYEKHFVWVGQMKKIIVSGMPLALCHYPMRSWLAKAHGGYHLYGHCHGAVEPGLDRSMDVGVDTHDYSPWAWEEIHERLKDLPIYSGKTA
jgi:calcineurin-like phosphoesterase family protein